MYQKVSELNQLISSDEHVEGICTFTSILMGILCCSFGFCLEEETLEPTMLI
jgi:hypothetical protein